MELFKKINKILFATTALVATAGVAAADGITVTGYFEMGVVGGTHYQRGADGFVGTADDTDGGSQFWTSHEITFTGAGEADNGLTFGGVVQLDEAAASGGQDDNGASVFIAYGDLRLDMGDTDGALDWAVDEVGYGGSIADDHTGHAGYSGNGGFGTAGGLIAAGAPAAAADATFGIGLDGLYDGQVARATYSAGDLRVAASMEVADDRQLGTPGVEAGAVMAIGAKYRTGGLSFGAGYQWATIEVGATDLNLTAMAGSITYAMDAITVGLNVGRTNAEILGVDLGVSHVGVGASYNMNALTIAANYGQYTADLDVPGVDDVSVSGFGVSATYDLGGGLTAQFGYGSSRFDDVLALDDSNRWSLGMAMAF